MKANEILGLIQSTQQNYSSFLQSYYIKCLSGKRPILYLSGPMTGYEDWNIPTFNRMAKKLRQAGHIILNPAELSEAGEAPWEVYMALDMKIIYDTYLKGLLGGIVLLDGWEESKGATMEYDAIVNTLKMSSYTIFEDDEEIKLIGG